MKSVTKKIDSESSQIQERIALLAEQFSQSEIARRTRTPVSNVNRYIGGTRVPAEFCGALVQGMGVNPAWLLTGEGAPFLSDVTAGTENMAADMLELVEALNAVSRMRLGSLTGKHHLRVLRELNDALSTYRELRTRLNERSVPILKQLCDDMRRHSDRQQYDIVTDLLKAGRQIADFCQDREQLRRLQANEAQYAIANGRPEEALAISRDVFARTLTGSDRLDHNSVIQAHNLVASLCRNYLFEEARRVARATLELAANKLGQLEAVSELRTLAGVVEVELGNLAEGLGLLGTNFPRTSGLYLTHSVGPVLRAFLLTGLLTFEDVDHKGGLTVGKGRHIVRYSIWLEDPGKLELVSQRYVGTNSREMVEPDILESTQARLLKELLERPRKSAIKPALAELAEANPMPIPEAVAKVLCAIYAGQLRYLCKDRKGAIESVMETEALLAALPEGVGMDMLARAMHARNALRALPQDHHDGGVRHRARAFFNDHYARGYAFLREYATNLPPTNAP